MRRNEAKSKDAFASNATPRASFLKMMTVSSIDRAFKPESIEFAMVSKCRS
jgi:hypothetical protein